jgi:hypothetical protein
VPRSRRAKNESDVYVSVSTPHVEGPYLSELGRREEALAAAEEAAGIYRALAQARPAAFVPISQRR